jgi:hypothetical protein
MIGDITFESVPGEIIWILASELLGVGVTETAF